LAADIYFALQNFGTGQQYLAFTFLKSGKTPVFGEKSIGNE
jgi:hypothetical protein